MLFLTSILLVLFGVLSGATEDDICKERRPTHCYNTSDAPTFFPDSEEALDKQCQIILPRMKCLLDFKKKCADTETPSELEDNLEDIYTVFVEACDKDSDLNKGLALHLPCIEGNIKGHVATCRPIVKRVLEEMTSHLNLDFDSEDVFPNDEVRAKYICTDEALNMACFVASTTVKCGEEAGEISASILDRVGMFLAMCPEDIRGDIKTLVALVQPLMELGVAGLVSEIE